MTQPHLCNITQHSLEVCTWTALPRAGQTRGEQKLKSVDLRPGCIVQCPLSAVNEWIIFSDGIAVAKFRTAPAADGKTCWILDDKFSLDPLAGWPGTALVIS